MTEDQAKLLYIFEDQVRKLMHVCENLKQENNELNLQLAALNKLNSGLQEDNKTIKVKYENLKTARIISVKQDDLKGAKNRLSKLVKEVDKCIALMNS
ncbi:MAG: hypothetical protein LBV57_06055 [Candidatus Symbiothrix sp.]|jgi:glycerol-3-phosphate responsive antiterminator|nr:hypothetical protein [Candidatus Symbiothrix sp.]